MYATCSMWMRWWELTKEWVRHVPKLASRNRQNYKSLKFVKLGLSLSCSGYVCGSEKVCKWVYLMLLLLLRVSVCLYIVSVADWWNCCAPTDSNVVARCCRLPNTLNTPFVCSHPIHLAIYFSHFPAIRSVSHWIFIFGIRLLICSISFYFYFFSLSRRRRLPSFAIRL